MKTTSWCRHSQSTRIQNLTLLTISFENQPAVDTGGPKREFYAQLFHGIVTSDGSVVPLMFEGAEGRLMPSYNSSVVYTGMMKIMGKIIAHSIVQCGVGFPYLSPVCYWYLITGDVSKAISYGNTEDVRDIEYADLIHKVTKWAVEILCQVFIIIKQEYSRAFLCY